MIQLTLKQLTAPGCWQEGAETCRKFCFGCGQTAEIVSVVFSKALQNISLFITSRGKARPVNVLSY